MKMRVLILGYGEMGHALEYLLQENHDVRIWSRSGSTNLENEASKARVILFCLPVNAHREIASRIAHLLEKESLCLSIAKGLDESGMTAAQIFQAALAPNHHYGVIYGPMISEEIMLGGYGFADVILREESDFSVIHTLFHGSRLVCEQADDMVGCSWSVILKNVYAILFGVADELKLGDNMRGHLMVAALAELSDIVKSLGGQANTPFSYAGLGDLLTTSTSISSHHHELGRKLASGQYSDISGEGVHTLAMVKKHNIFDSKRYPLFTLVDSIVSQPKSLKSSVEEYLRNIRIH